MAENQLPSYRPDDYCGCVGYAYVPIQYINEIYPFDEGLCNGTIFPELHLTICEYGKVCKENGGEM